MSTTPLLDLLYLRPTGMQAFTDVNGKEVTLGDLLFRSRSLAAGWKNMGVLPGQTTLLATKPDTNFVLIVFAALWCGLRVAVIDPEMGREHYKNKLRQLAPDWAFVDSRLLLLQEHPLLRWCYFKWSKKGLYFPKNSKIRVVSVGPWMPIISTHRRLKHLFQNDAGVELPGLSPTDAFFITYTSGTTSEPKGVVHTVGALANSITLIADLLQASHNKKLATHLPHFALIGMQAGVAVHMWDNELSAQKKYDFIQKNEITTLFGPPSDYLQLIVFCENQGCSLPDCLQHLFLGSAPVYGSFLNRLTTVLTEHVQLTCLYGMTENLLVCTIDGREKALIPARGGDVVGRPVEGVSLKCASDGEVLVQSNQLYLRYNHFETREDWHATGDLGHLDGHGRLVLTGRKKDMILRGNFNLYPGLYEPTINSIPGVTDSAFVGVYDEKRHDEVVVLFVETHRNLTESDLRGLLEFGKYSIDREALPDRIVFGKLPRSGRQQKVNKNALRQMLTRGKSQTW